MKTTAKFLSLTTVERTLNVFPLAWLCGCWAAYGQPHNLGGDLSCMLLSVWSPPQAAQWCMVAYIGSVLPSYCFEPQKTSVNGSKPKQHRQPSLLTGRRLCCSARLCLQPHMQLINQSSSPDSRPAPPRHSAGVTPQHFYLFVTPSLVFITLILPQ